MKNEDLVKVHAEKPAGYVHNIEIVACYLKRGEEYLFLKKASGRNEAETWGVAGGKMEPKEDSKKATIREVFEETGIEIIANNLSFEKHLFVENPYYGKYLLSIYSYSCDFNQKITLSEEHIEYKWLSLTQAKSLPLLLGGLQSLTLFETHLSDR